MGPQRRPLRSPGPYLRSPDPAVSFPRQERCALAFFRYSWSADTTTTIHHTAGSIMKKVWMSWILMAAAAAVSGAALAQDTARAEDRAQIEELMWRYARALDSFDAEAYASVYTEDGQFQAGATATKGRDALRQMVANLGQNRTAESPPMFHMTTDSYIEFIDENTARHHTYWLTVFGAAGQGQAPRVAAAGRGVDELVRVNGQWLIRSRNVAPQD